MNGGQAGVCGPILRPARFGTHRPPDGDAAAKARRAGALWIALSLAAPVACAGPEPGAQLWLNAGGFSWHFKRPNTYDESNRGLGIEYRTSAEIAFMVGGYRNSVRRNTAYATVNWQPWSVGGLKLGAAVGVMNGYPMFNQGNTFLMALPMATYEGRRFGVNLGLVPPVKNLKGLVSVQFKLRLN